MIRNFLVLFLMVLLVSACANNTGLRQLSVAEKKDVAVLIDLFALDQIEAGMRDEMSVLFIKKLITRDDLSENHMRLAVKAMEDVLTPVFQAVLQDGMQEAFILEMDAEALQETRIWLESDAGRSFSGMLRRVLTRALEQRGLQASRDGEASFNARDLGRQYAVSLSAGQRNQLAAFFASDSGKKFIRSIHALQANVEKHWKRRYQKEQLGKAILLRLEQLMGEEGLREDRG